VASASEARVIKARRFVMAPILPRATRAASGLGVKR
jgi:hypothetical protein